MLKIDGFLFVKDKQLDNKFYWKCNKFASYCKSRAITNDGEVIKVPHEHNHSGDAVSVELRSFMNRAKGEAKQTRDSPQYVISTAASQLSENAAQDLPAISSIKRVNTDLSRTNNALEGCHRAFFTASVIPSSNNLEVPRRSKKRTGFARHSNCKTKSREPNYEDSQDMP